jgi:asparagine synthase (glutamine-hydrolysing)
VQLYQEYGKDLAQHIYGSFVIALIDGQDLLLFRDGAGVPSIYYAVWKDRLYFAVEPKAILHVSNMTRRIRMAAVAQYFTFSFIPGSETMLEGVFELLPGHSLEYKHGEKPILKRYFCFEEEGFFDVRSEGEWISQFQSSFTRAVCQRLPKGSPIGVFLSGGIDSSIVAVEAARHHSSAVHTYSLYFGNKYPHELSFAREVAKGINSIHSEFLLEPKMFLPKLHEVIWHLDDPIGDPITVPNFFLAERASRDVDVIFNGEGGDPLFGGPKNIPMLLHHWYGGVERDEAFREQQYLASYRRAYDDLDQLLSQDVLAVLHPKKDLENILSPFFSNAAPKLFLNKLSALNIRLKGGQLILPKVDRMLGAWGLRAQAPLFDEKLIRLSFAIPPKLKLNQGIEKILLKRSFQHLLPESVVNRPKSGMRVPVHFWFQKEMKKFAKHLLHPKAIKRAGLLNPERVKQLLDYDIEGAPGRYGLRLWMVITLELWRRIVVERDFSI